jgi:vanillate O-demethylase ferredoxin subunit
MGDSTFPLKVKKVTQEAEGVRCFDLVGADGRALPAFGAGAHIDLHLGEGLIRQYSLCNGPEQTNSYSVAVKLEPQSRGGSKAMYEGLREGDIVRVSGPRNNFPIDATARHHLLLAAGIGVTPLLSMARHLRATGASYEMKYFTRSSAHTAFHRELSAPGFSDRVDFRYALEPAQLGDYLGDLLKVRPEGGHVYLCGPRPFMAMVEEVAARTYPSEAVHLEYFSADEALLAGPRESFTVKLARSGREIEVPAGESILDALARNGLHIDMLCQQGVCGTCLTGVVEGIPDHRDAFLTDAEKLANDKIMVCCSRSLTPQLVLDL